jgi:hypothetical protein
MLKPKKQPLEDSPKPASSGDLSSQHGAVSSSSSDGPLGRGAARGGAAPRISLYNRLGAYGGHNPWPDSPKNAWPPRRSVCTRCYGIFNTNPWKRDRKPVCERCGAERWAESPAYLDFRHHYINKGGKPAKGIRDPDEIWALITALFTDNELVRAHMVANIEKWEAGEPVRIKDLRAPLEIVYHLATGVNADALAKTTPWDKRTINRMKERGKKLSQNPTYIEVREDEMEIVSSSPPTIVERVTDHEARLMEVERQLGLPPGGDKAGHVRCADRRTPRGGAAMTKHERYNRSEKGRARWLRYKDKNRVEINLRERIRRRNAATARERAFVFAALERHPDLKPLAAVLGFDSDDE